MSIHPAIVLTNVSKLYTIESQQVPALRGVDLRVKRGQMVAVTGKSGAGKSTLLHVIGTLDQPTQGTLLLDGVDLSKVPDRAASAFRNEKIGFVFQTNNLLAEFSAIENVMIPGLIGGLSRSQVRERAAGLLKAVGLAERTNHRPGELSGGEQQRVAIARALLMSPPIILADEPTGNLDLGTAHAVRDLLIQLCEQFQITMMLVTHDPDLAAHLPYRIVMEDGRIVDNGGLS